MPASHKGGASAFWLKHRIKDSHKQPGNPEASGGHKPSSKIKMSPEKAKKILKDNSVHGHPLTKKQKGLFGSIAGKSKK
jgi:hypothetical protein